MPTKKGAGGRQQNYDPHTGKFAKTDFSTLLLNLKPTAEERKTVNFGFIFVNLCKAILFERFLL